MMSIVKSGRMMGLATVLLLYLSNAAFAAPATSTAAQDTPVSDVIIALSIVIAGFSYWNTKKK